MYLAFDALNAGVVVFAIGLFGSLFAAPFAIHARLGGLLEADARWERALLAWGALSLVAFGLGLLGGAIGEFDGDSLVGALGIVTAGETALVLATLATWLIFG